MDWLKTTLIDRRSWGEDVYTCRFERPDRYDFSAGQYLVLQLGDGLTKPFSHASAPGDPWIEITTHFSGSEFKRSLASLASGSAAAISPPLGQLRAPADSTTVTYLIGGIGITPIRSMLRDAAQRGAHSTGVLVYGNRSPACVPYREELDAYAGSSMRVVHVFEDVLDERSAEKGFITPELVRRYADPGSGLFVATGPPAMVSAMEHIMDVLEVESERRVIEKFGRE